MSIDDGFFPSSPRVIYKRSPLYEVIFQVRFPTILKIESEVPADFQEAIRAVFPLVERKASLEFATPANMPRELASVFGAAADRSMRYQFLTEDRSGIISLAPDAFALTCTAYQRWETFAALFQPALDALYAIYKPTFISRIGLRYTNAIRRDILADSSTEWERLVSGQIAGELRANFGSARIVEAQRVLRLADDASNGILLQHGIGTVGEEQVPAYLIDIDCYRDTRSEVQHVAEHLTIFNVRARHAFRWCISDEVHEALGPHSVDELDPNR